MPLVDDCGPGFSSQISHIVSVVTQCREVTLSEDDMLALGMQVVLTHISTHTHTHTLILTQTLTFISLISEEAYTMMWK